MLTPTSGHYPTLTDEIIDRIVDAAPRLMVVNRIATYARIAPTNLRRWLDMGEKDHSQGKDTIFARLWTRFEEARSKKVEKMTIRLEESISSIMWLLEKAFPKEYGKQSEEFERAVEGIYQLAEAIKNGAQKT